ncbi:hypothetical protein MRB53_024466 [Persea americana]|uniref:Uncharacterized protein n=1 Tax=Persea americana TaxID=3435 RepID=A0ACC2LD92_PERAE|nr:hypothetical protein MRB53_024466 [Persea americana]
MGNNGGEVSCSYSSPLPSTFPYGLRILVVDDDPTCLMVVEKMLKTCRYEVTTCDHPATALSILRERRGCYDVVLTDVYMPDINGFELLEIVGLEMDLPVVMMSANCDVSVAMSGIKHGACYYLMKPISMGEVKNIWQHIIRKHKEDMKDAEEMASFNQIMQMTSPNEESENKNSPTAWDPVNQAASKQRKKKKGAIGVRIEDKGKKVQSLERKPRVLWNAKLHQKFVKAIDQIGIDRAVPKKILEIIDVPGLTRENIASHLQKYRLFLRRLNEENQSGRLLPPTFKSKLGIHPEQPMVSTLDPAGTLNFPEPFNPIGVQPTAAFDMQNSNPSMLMTSVSRLPFINQDSQSNDPFATSGFGQYLNLPTNIQPILQSGSSSSATRVPLLQQNNGSMGFGMVPQQMEACSSLIVDTMPTTHWPTKPIQRTLESASLVNFGMQNAQNNNLTNMGNAELMNRFKQFSISNSTSNYTGLQVSKSADFYRMTQIEPFGEGSSNMNYSSNLVNDISNQGKIPPEPEMNNKGKRPLDAKDKGKMPIVVEEEEDVFLPELTAPDFNLDLYMNLDNLSQYPMGHLGVIQEEDVLMGGSSSSHDIDSLLQQLHRSTFGNSSDIQPDGNGTNDMVFKQAQDGTKHMESNFEVNPFHMGDNDKAE